MDKLRIVAHSGCQGPISPGQNCAFRGSTGVPKQCLWAPDWLEQRYNGPGKYEHAPVSISRVYQME